jgi:hypothetical protein
MTCHDCLLDAGRTTKSNACCELRFLARAPEAVVQQHLATLSRIERETFPSLLLIEQQRLMQVRNQRKKR